MLTNTQSYVTYQGNGATTSFPYSFPVPLSAYLQVSITNNLLNPPVTTTLSPSQYAVTGIGNGIAGAPNQTPGGTVVYSPPSGPLPSGWTITIQRTVPYVQTTTLVNQGGFYPAVVEGGLDYQTMLAQQLYAFIQQVSQSLTTQINEVTMPGIEAPAYLQQNSVTQSLASLSPVYLTANTQATTISGFTNLMSGHEFKIIINDAFTTIQFATWWSGLPVGSIIGHQGQEIIFSKGDVLDCVTDGVYVYVIDSEPMVPAILPLPANFSVTNAGSANSVSVSASSITLPNIAGLKLFQTWASQVDSMPLNFTASSNGTLGAGGLDTGTVAPSTWYYVWLIGDGTNIKALLSTGPYWTFVDKTYVSNYTYARLVGCVLTDANSHFVNFHQFGNKVLYDLPEGTGLATQSSYTHVTSAWFPPIAVTALLSVQFVAAAAGTASFQFSADGTNDYFDVYCGSTTVGMATQFELPFLTAQSYWYKDSNVGGTPTVFARGFMLNL